jgi:HD-GYP domain-containing protein (c-di-GMP phosphodiesterase class II)
LKRILVKDLKPGMVVGRAIFSSEGRVLLHSGMVLTDTYIAGLDRLGVNSVYIRDEIFGSFAIQDVISEETRNYTVKMMRDSFTGLEKNHGLNIRVVKDTVDNIIDELFSNRNLLLNLSDIRTYDDYTFAHSVNVSILSMMAGITMGYDRMQLHELGLGALLHDIGKIRISLDILNKPGELTREEFMEIKQHPQYGFDILRCYNDVSLLSSHIAFQHHERWDGQGYPRSLVGKDILEYARVVAVADVYDALLADRPYRPSYSLNQTLTIIKRMSGIYLDPTCVNALLANVAVYPVGTIVELSTGDIGMVVDVNRVSPARPVVRIVFNSRRKRLSTIREIDLSKLTTVLIVKTLSDHEIQELTEQNDT